MSIENWWKQLEDGYIPQNEPCPFILKCKEYGEYCPSENNLYDHKYSCALARIFDRWKGYKQ